MSPPRTNADRAGALRTLEQRALAEGHPMLAIVLHGHAEIGEWSDPPRFPEALTARAAWLTSIGATMRECAMAQRVAETQDRERAEMAEAPLVVLREVTL